MIYSLSSYSNHSNARNQSEVDCSFFLVTVDLWSADGKHEMNLVLHPSSADRFTPTQSSSKTKRRGVSTSGPSARPPGNQTPAGRSTPTPSQYRPGDQVGQIAFFFPTCLNEIVVADGQHHAFFKRPCALRKSYIFFISG